MQAKSWVRFALVVGAGLVFSLGPGTAKAVTQAVTFQENTQSLDPIYTRSISGMTGDWTVWKYIFNGSPYKWTDFHVKLQTMNAAGSWVDSPESDGISFGQPTPFDEWLKSVKVDINGIYVDGWHVNRTNQPADKLDFYFDTFGIQPGQTLSLHFDMTDFGTNTWRLVQVPTIPEPQTHALLLLGLAGVGLAARRGRSA
nr:PEP-CTERM sorting domain-containing protein [uncultured Roseateles sp.]